MRTLHLKEYLQDVDTDSLTTVGIVVAMTAVLMLFLWV